MPEGGKADMRILRSILLLIALAASAASAASFDDRVMLKAKVVSQSIASDETKGAGRRGNTMIVESANHRMEWSETTKNLFKAPPNTEIEYYQENEHLVVIDQKGKKHKFIMMRLELLDREKQKPPAAEDAPRE